MTILGARSLASGANDTGKHRLTHSTSPLQGIRFWIANALAALSFIIFATAALSLHQWRSIPFAVEQNGPFPVVLSHFLLGAPPGLVDSGLRDFFWQGSRYATADEALNRAVREAKATHDLAPITDGNGIGGIIMVRTAFALFGIHARALTYFFVLVLGVSTAAFIFRYQDKRIFAVPILFGASTALILTPISSPEIAAQVPFGGIRSYAIVGILPALHWCFDLQIDVKALRVGCTTRWILLGAQICILGLAVLVRGSPAYLLGPVIVVSVCHLKKNWSRLGLRAMLWRLALPAAALIVGLSSIAPLAFPEYALTGRAQSIVWHRVLISFGVHPAWPFAGLREMFPCREIPEGLVSSISDRNGHCVWWAFAHDHALSDAQVIQGLYDGEYETAMRSAVMKIIREHPKQSAETFLYFKPRKIINTLFDMLVVRNIAYPNWIIALTAIQIGILITFIAGWPRRESPIDAMYAACIISIFIAFGFAPQFVAWSFPYTVIDIVVYVLCAAIVLFWLIFAAAESVIARLVQSRSRIARPLNSE